MAIETNIQTLLHAFDQGRAAFWIKRVIVALLLLLVALMWFGFKFNGFSSPEAMDQAQIGRQIANGQGFTTLYARPLAMHLALARTGRLDVPMPEVSQAPLGPLLNAAAFRLSRIGFAFGPGVTVLPAERLITAVSFVFFVGAIILTYLLGRRLFDAQLALIAVGLLVVTDILWRFAFSGLPQMPMLFFFSGTLLSLAVAIDENAAGRRIRAVLFTLLASLLLGLLTLGNGLGVWIFAGFWLFAVIVIRPRWLVALTMPAPFFMPLLPWAWHNWHALRNPLGLSFYELLRKHSTDPLAWLADFEPVMRFRLHDFASNIGENALVQASALFTYLGGSAVAAAFFLAVFVHYFKRWQPSQFRWAVLFMWLGAAAGMSVFGVDRAVSVNQLHVLFLPIMMLYGLAFLLVTWSRLGFEIPVARGAFIFLLYAVSAVPLLSTAISTPLRFNWPPYLPPVIARFDKWIEPKEALASDIPWATAWYSGRLSLLLPENIGQFELIHSEGLLRAPLVGLYLTPFSGDRAAYDGIINGRYREWARFVLREVRPEDLNNWMLRSAVNLPVDGQSIFYSDRPRWR